MKKEKMIIAGISLFLLFLSLSGLLLPEANEMQIDKKLLSPSPSFLFGTDQFGRDVFLRTIHGFRVTFLWSLAVVVTSFPIGLLLGTVLGYYGGLVDELFYQFSNVVLSFPVIILAMIIAAYTNANMFLLLLLLSLTLVIINTKIVRGEIKIIKNEDYIKNLRVLGISDFRIISHHLLIKAFKVIVPTFAFLIGHIILSISSFSFLGFGIKAPEPEIGMMLSESIRFMSCAPWLMILPGLFQFFAIFSILVLANNLKMLIVRRRASKHD